MIVYLWVVLLLSWGMAIVSAANVAKNMMGVKEDALGAFAVLKFLFLALVWFAVTCVSLVFIVNGV